MSGHQDMDAWKDADALFDQWLDLDAEERDGWLAARELAPEVRDRLQRLVDAHQRPSAVLSTPASDLAGVRLGSWTLESELGRGGMAVVYRASRNDGIARQDAALKVLTMGALGATGRERFRREAEILAHLNHPNITPLVDSGIEADGTCWLAMPLVEGERIDAWCDTHRLDARAVTRLFLQVCDAVACAHRNLVIHRDLKPSNVLVEADGHVRLLDFGIGQFAGAEAERTRTMWRALTPGYAAPEQLRGELPTTAIDIYGLGALLHRLLTGRTPHASDERTASTRPSMLVRASGDAYHRHYVPLRSDLDRVLLKALAEEPGHRYPSAEALADDLRRWLDGRPVLARQPGLAYRARKFVGRHRVGVAAGVLLALSLAGGVGATLWQAREARLEADRALAVRNFMVQLFEASDPDVAQGRVITARELLDQGAHQVRTDFRETPRLRSEMLLLLGDLYRRIGEIEAGLPLVREGADLARGLGDTVLEVQAGSHLGRIHLDRAAPAEAVPEFEAAARVLESSGQAPGIEHARILYGLGEAMAAAGLGEDAIRRCEEALELARRQGAPDEALFFYLFALASTVDLSGSGQAERTDALLRESLALRSIDSIPPSHRLAVHNMLAGLAQERGDLPEAVAQMQQAVDLSARIYAPHHPERAVMQINMAWSLLNVGRLDDAESLLRQALAIQEAFDPDGVTPLRAGIHHNLALALELAERDEEAEPFSKGAWEGARDERGPESMHFAVATTNLGNLYRRLGRFDEAEPLLHQGLALRRKLVGDLHPQVGHTIVQLGLLRLDQGRPREALALADEALAAYDATDFRDPRRVALAGMLRARALADSGRVEEGEAVIDRLFAEARAAGADNGTQWVRFLAARADFMAAYRPELVARAAAEARDAYAGTFGPEHPGTRRYGALAGSH